MIQNLDRAIAASAGGRMTTRTQRTHWAATTLSTDEMKLVDDVRIHTEESRSDFLRQAIRLKLHADVNQGLDDPDLELRVFRYLNQHT